MVVGAPCAVAPTAQDVRCGPGGSGRSAQRAGGRLRLVNHGGATEGEASGPLCLGCSLACSGVLLSLCYSDFGGFVAAPLGPVMGPRV